MWPVKSTLNKLLTYTLFVICVFGLFSIFMKWIFVDLNIRLCAKLFLLLSFMLTAVALLIKYRYRELYIMYQNYKDIFKKIKIYYFREFLKNYVDKELMAKFRKENSLDIMRLQSFINAHNDMQKLINESESTIKELLDDNDDFNDKLNEYEEQIVKGMPWTSIPKTWEKTGPTEEEMNNFSNYVQYRKDFVAGKIRLAKLLDRADQTLMALDDNTRRERYEDNLKMLGVKNLASDDDNENEDDDSVNVNSSQLSISNEERTFENSLQSPRIAMDGQGATSMSDHLSYKRDKRNRNHSDSETDGEQKKEFKTCVGGTKELQSRRTLLVKPRGKLAKAESIDQPKGLKRNKSKSPISPDFKGCRKNIYSFPVV